MKFIQVFCCVILFFFLSIIAPSETSAQYAYVTNSNSISVINTATNILEKIIPLPDDNYPDIDLTPDGRFAYLTAFSGHVVAFNTITNTVDATIPIPDGRPYGITITPDGKYAYVTCFGTEILAVIDITTNILVDQIFLNGSGSVYGIAIMPDGNTAYVARRYSNYVSVVDLLNKTITADIRVGEQPLNLTASPKGDYVYVANSYSNNISVISTTLKSIIANVPVGLFPHNICFNSSGNYAYVVNLIGSSISIINTSTFDVSLLTGVGNGPLNIALTRDNLYAYLTNNYAESNGVSVIDASLNTVIATIDISHPLDVAIAFSSPPSVITDGASDINLSSCTLNGIVNPQNSETSVYFEWGEDNTLANFNSTSPQLIGAGASDVEVSTDLQGLKANTTYYFRVAGENIFGTAKGDILSFNTLTIQQGIELIMDVVIEDLITGKLGEGCRNALIKKLNAAIEQINKNKYHTAINQLNAFINHLSALLKTGKIALADGNLLVTLATEAIEQLSEMDKLSSDNFLVPSDYELVQNYPNPFNPVTQIRFGIPQTGNVTLRIYDTNGQLVKTLVNGVMAEGTYEIQWNADDDNGMKVASGIYFCRLIANNSNINFSKVNKMILLK